MENCWEQPTPWASSQWQTRLAYTQQCTKELLQQQQVGETGHLSRVGARALEDGSGVTGPWGSK